MQTVDELLDEQIDQSFSAPRARTQFAATSPSFFEWFFVIGGGLMFALPFVLGMGETMLNSVAPIHWYLWIGALISSPHVYATFVRLQRKNMEGKVSYWLGFPLYILTVGILALGSWFGQFVLLITAVNVWQSYHYLRQTYGVGCLYGSQAQFDATDRRLRWWAYHLTFPALVLGRWDTLYTVWNGQTYSFMPLHIPAPIMAALWCVAAVGVLTSLVGEGRLMKNNGRQYSPAGIINFAICCGIHYYGFVVASHFQRGFLAVTIFHAVQYLALVWWLERAKAVERGWRWVERIPNFVGFCLFWIALYFVGSTYENRVTVALNHFWLQASAVLLAAISAHHYTVDTFIWRRAVGK
jgi:hypothetical protein